MRGKGGPGRWVAAILVGCVSLAHGAGPEPADALSAEIAFPSMSNQGTSYAEFRNVRELGAKGDGVTDDTAAFREGIASAKKAPHEWVWLYVPNGTYVLSDTLGWARRFYLIGQSRTGVVLKLKDACTGFGDPKKAKPVIHTGIPGRFYDNDSQANAAFSNYIMNLTVDTGKGNPGAIGIRYTTHNQGVIGETTVRSGDGSGPIGVDLSQTEFGPGMLRNLTVEGFDVGIDTPANVSHVTIANLTLKHQNKLGIRNRFPMSIAGLTSENKVPVIRSEGGIANLALVQATLTGGAADAAAIFNGKDASGLLRAIKTQGYRSAVDGQPKTDLEELVFGFTHITPGASFKSIPTAQPPRPAEEPVGKWAFVEPEADATAAIQKAIDSGAATVCLKWGAGYKITDTIHIRGNVRRIIGYGASLGGPKDTFVDARKPMLRLEGEGKPVTIEFLGTSTWPHQHHALEVAGPRTLYLNCFSPGGWVTATPEATGQLFIDEGTFDLKVSKPLTVYIRQYNTENNPFSPRDPKRANRTFLTNDGASVWILGWKTEAPAREALTTNAGRTEVLGGFMRDHFGPDDMKGFALPPHFQTEDASVAATYFQYAWGPGHARALQAVETFNGKKREWTVNPSNLNVGLYMATPAAK